MVFDSFNSPLTSEQFNKEFLGQMITEDSFDGALQNEHTPRINKEAVGARRCSKLLKPRNSVTPEMNVQFQALIEENNQLKIEKRVLEGKYMQVKEKLEELKLQKIGSQLNDKMGDSKMAIDLMKSEIESKNAMIRELEFQLSSMQSEDHLLKVTNELQKRELEKMGDELGEKDELEELLEEANEQIEELNEEIAREEEKNIVLQRKKSIHQGKTEKVG